MSSGSLWMKIISTLLYLFSNDYFFLLVASSIVIYVWVFFFFPTGFVYLRKNKTIKFISPFNFNTDFSIFLSRRNLILVCYNLFQQIHATERNYEVASSLLGVGVDYAHISAANYTRVLFLLSRCMVSSDTPYISSSKSEARWML